MAETLGWVVLTHQQDDSWRDDWDGEVHVEAGDACRALGSAVNALGEDNVRLALLVSVPRPVTIEAVKVHAGLVQTLNGPLLREGRHLMEWHRFDYDWAREVWVCVPPPAGGTRPEGYCPGCGVKVTAETCYRLLGNVENPGDTLLSTLVQMGAGHLPGVDYTALVAVSENTPYGAVIYDVPSEAGELEREAAKFRAECLTAAGYVPRLKADLDAMTARAEAAEHDLGEAAQLVTPPGLVEAQQRRIAVLEQTLGDVLAFVADEAPEAASEGMTVQWAQVLRGPGGTTADPLAARVADLEDKLEILTVVVREAVVHSDRIGFPDPEPLSSLGLTTDEVKG